MNKYTLIKLSAPGWEKSYTDMLQLKAELAEWVCKSCHKEFETEYGEPPQSILDLLSTACGCEFMFENAEFEKQRFSYEDE